MYCRKTCGYHIVKDSDPSSSKMDDLEHSLSSQLDQDIVESSNDATSEHISSHIDQDDVEKDTAIHEQDLEHSISSLFSDSETDQVM